VAGVAACCAQIARAHLAAGPFSPQRRFFVLYKVPQGSVLVYYEKQSVSGDDILGYVDLRRAVDVRSVRRTVLKEEAAVIEVVTPDRVFVLAPQTVNESLSTPLSPRIQYILGWPVPEPAFGREFTIADDGGSEAAKARVRDEWFDALRLQMRTEQEVKKYLVTVLVDSTETLPPSILLRAAPTEMALLDVGDPDLAHVCWSYRDITSLSTPVPSELHISVRVPGSTVRVVFKSDRAREVKGVVEEHIKKILTHQAETGAAPGGAGARVP
jgi:hypothetical protein